MEVWTKINLFWFIEVKFIDDMLRSAEMGMAINGLKIGCSSFKF